MDDAQLQTVWQQRQFDDHVVPLGEPLATLIKHTIAKRARRLGKLAEIWDELIPAGIRDHTALEGFSHGVLTVAVDSAAHRFKLSVLLDGGLRRQIQARFDAALRKIRLIPGRFDAIEL
ncbi:MAG: DciA family protein [Planctomycetota bacterium]|jgi:hypothetical protein